MTEADARRPPGRERDGLGDAAGLQDRLGRGHLVEPFVGARVGDLPLGLGPGAVRRERCGRVTTRTASPSGRPTATAGSDNGRMPTFTPALLRSLQERAARAQPVEHVVYDAGWWLRRTDSASWWLAAVLPHGEPADLLAQVERAEQAYAAAGDAASFQISPGVCPDGLDGLLDARGYRRDGRISLRCAATADVLSALEPRLESRVEDRADDAWFDVWHRVHGHGDPGPDRANLERLVSPAGYATVLVDGEAVAVGRAVAESGWTGLFGLATLPEARGRGAGRELLRVLAAWARGQGAPDMYLQVESGNAPANALYAKAGFTEALGYHYRAKG